jgi:hypothetical protein
MSAARPVTTATGAPVTTPAGAILRAEPGSPVDRVPVSLRGILVGMDPVSAYALGVAHGRSEARRERGR